MNDIVINIKQLGKQYQLGAISTGSLNQDLASAWARFKGLEDPNSKISLTNELSINDGAQSIWALKNINLQVTKGEILGVIGKNGAGKSTLLKILSRITSPTEGEIKIKGRLGSLLEVGTGFHPELTGRENIFLNGAILGMKKNEIKRHLDQIIDFSGIEKYIDTPIKRYSTGMKVRLGFSVAAFLQVDILLVDEVLAVGDLEFQTRAIGKMNQVASMEGKTILFVSHNIKAVKELTNRTLFLSKGGMVQIGNTDKVVNQYLNSQDLSKGKIENILQVDELIMFDSITLTNNKNEKKQSFFYDEEIIINYKYNLKLKLDRLRIAFNISDTYNNIVFNSADFPTGLRTDELISSGTYQASAIIPANFFNEGTFFIGISCDVPFKKIIINEKNIFTFTIIFPRNMTGGVNEKFEGPIFPKIKWKTEKIG